MKWYNEPVKWDYENDTLSMFVTQKSDYWRITHYGFIQDNGPFYYTNIEGDFEVSVKIKGNYNTLYDQMGLMLRLDEEHWIKTGVEYVDGVYNLSTVTTNKHSSWNIIPLRSNLKQIWIKAIRKTDAVEIYYSLDGEIYIMSNISYLPKQKNIMAGMMAASPKGKGFEATFEEFKITGLSN